MAVGGGGVYLPPVIQELSGSIADLVAKLRESQAMLADWASKSYEARLTADVTPLMTSLAAAESAAAAFAANPITIRVQVEGLAEALAAILATREAANRGGGRGGLLSKLLWGGGFFGMAGLGSVGSFAGFGFEHLIMTALGLAGSAAGGALGGGLLGLGALGTTFVGMGSDILVAREAMKQMTAQTQAFGAAFNQVTAQAQQTFINRIALPVMAVAQTYFPLIAAAAQRNFTIIGNSIKPLLAFLSGPGHKIFTDLENVFARDLPIGVGIFTQALELVLKTIDHIATSNNFGAFMQRILGFVTRLNTTGFGHFMGQVDHMIALFHVWVKFIGAAARVVVDLFSGTLGLGTSIIQTLTGMLQQLDTWLRSTSGKASMHSIFAAHKAEVMALLQLIPPLVGAFGRIYIAIAPTLASIVTLIATVAGKVLDFLTSLKGGTGVFASWVLGIGLILAKLGLIGPIISLVMTIIKGFGLTSLLSMGIVGVAILALIGIGLLLVTHWNQVKAIAEKVWGFIGPYIRGALAAVGGFIKAFVADAKAWWESHKTEVLQVWSAIVGIVKTYVKVVIDLIVGDFKLLMPFVKAVWDFVINYIRLAWDVIKTVVSVALDLVTGHWKKAWTDLKNGLGSIMGDIIRLVTTFGRDIVAGIVNGIRTMAGTIVKALTDAVGGALNAAKHLLGISSPSLVFAAQVGAPIVQGIAAGILGNQHHALAAMASLSKNLLAAGRVGSSFGGGSGMAFAGGGGLTIGSMPITVNVQGGSSASAQQIGSSVGKEVSKQLGQVIKALNGGVYVPGRR